LCNEHFSVDGTLIQSFASAKTFQPKASGVEACPDSPQGLRGWVQLDRPAYRRSVHVSNEDFREEPAASGRAGISGNASRTRTSAAAGGELVERGPRGTHHCHTTRTAAERLCQLDAAAAGARGRRVGGNPRPNRTHPQAGNPHRKRAHPQISCTPVPLPGRQLQGGGGWSRWTSTHARVRPTVWRS
jgi:hypothetical protein